MKIDPDKCVACGNCLPVCPMGAIYIDPALSRARINADECVECFTCYRGMSKEHLNPMLVRAIRRTAQFFRFRFDPEPDICPTDAIIPEELTWPRVVRRAFSDPQVPHESTGIHGRGTAEVKTNDVTNRVKAGDAGFVIEFGRPGVGARFRDIERVTRALAELGVEFESNNPVTTLMTDPARGVIRPEILNEKILSAIVEIKTQLERRAFGLEKGQGAVPRSRYSDQRRRLDALRRRRRRTLARDFGTRGLSHLSGKNQSGTGASYDSKAKRRMKTETCKIKLRSALCSFDDLK